MSLVESLGRSYCHSNFSGAVVKYEDKVVRILEVGNNTINVMEIDAEGRDVRLLNIPVAWLTGFSKFEYPRLGYRRVGNSTFFLSRRQGSSRGIRAGSTQVSMSPLTNLARSVPSRWMTRPADQVSNSAVEFAIHTPVFDELSDIPALLNGDRVSVILNESVMIEHAVTAEAFIVYYNETPVARMSYDGVISTTNPQFSDLGNPIYQRVA